MNVGKESVGRRDNSRVVSDIRECAGLQYSESILYVYEPVKEQIL